MSLYIETNLYLEDTLKVICYFFLLINCINTNNFISYSTMINDNSFFLSNLRESSKSKCSY